MSSENQNLTLQETPVISPSEIKDLQSLLHAGPVGLIIVIVLLFSKLKKDFLTDRIATEQSQKLLELRLSKIEAKLDFLLECLEDDDTKK